MIQGFTFLRALLAFSLLLLAISPVLSQAGESKSACRSQLAPRFIFESTKELRASSQLDLGVLQSSSISEAKNMLITVIDRGVASAQRRLLLSGMSETYHKLLLQLRAQQAISGPLRLHEALLFLSDLRSFWDQTPHSVKTSRFVNEFNRALREFLYYLVPVLTQSGTGQGFINALIVATDWDILAVPLEKLVAAAVVIQGPSTESAVRLDGQAEAFKTFWKQPLFGGSQRIGELRGERLQVLLSYWLERKAMNSHATNESDGLSQSTFELEFNKYLSALRYQSYLISELERYQDLKMHWPNWMVVEQRARARFSRELNSGAHLLDALKAHSARELSALRSPSELNSYFDSEGDGRELYGVGLALSALEELLPALVGYPESYPEGVRLAVQDLGQTLLLNTERATRSRRTREVSRLFQAFLHQ